MCYTGFGKWRRRARFIEERGLKLTYFVYVVVFKKLINVKLNCLPRRNKILIKVRALQNT
jgi:hypothetical protein